MRRIQQESVDQLKDFMLRTIGDTVSASISSHIQPIRDDITQERNERVEHNQNVDRELNAINNRLTVLEGRPQTSVSSASARIEHDEVVIKEFDKLRFSKTNAIISVVKLSSESIDLRK